MTPKQMARARERLGLTLEAMTSVLGYQGVRKRQILYDLETGRRPVREPQRRLVEATLSGYGPHIMAAQ